MTATRNKTISAKLNPYISVLRSTDEECVFSLYGRIKRLRWNHSGEGAYWFAGQSDKTPERGQSPKTLTPLEEKLLQTGILVDHERNPGDNQLLEASILGGGFLANLVCACLQKQYPDIVLRKSDDPAGYSTPGTGRSVTIVCPESATRGDISRMNQACLQNGQPFGFIYYNGKNLVAGPIVIPGKTPCIDCLTTWLQDNLDKRRRSGLTRKETNRIVAAVPYAANENAALRAVHMVLDQLAVASTKASNTLVGCQVHVPLLPQPDMRITRFAHNAGCPACHGGFGSLFSRAPEQFPDAASRMFTLRDISTCQLDSGYRSLDGHAARKLIESTIDRMGAAMHVQELHTGPLDTVIPSFRAELRTPGKGEALGFGKGIDKEQAYLSAAFEAVERLCSESRGNTPLLRAPWENVKDHALDIKKRIGTVHFYRNNEPFTRETPIDWVWGQNLLTGEPTLVPASMVYVGPDKFAGKFYNASTGGVAAGTSLEDAMLQGLMETIEHDAWMIWQANGTACPEVLKDSIEDVTIAKVIQGMEAYGYQVRIRYLETDIGIPVFRVWLVHPDSVETYASHGLGCHLNKHLALKRAVTEAKQAMPQTLYSKAPNTKYGSRGNRDILNSRHSLFYLYHFTQVDLSDKGTPLSMSQIPDDTTGSVSGDFKKTLHRLADKIPGMQAVGVNLTDPRIGIPVVRVIVVGLQQLSHPLQVVQDRLFTVPCQMGACDTPLQYRELFNGRYPF